MVRVVGKEGALGGAGGGMNWSSGMGGSRKIFDVFSVGPTTYNKLIQP